MRKRPLKTEKNVGCHLNIQSNTDNSRYPVQIEDNIKIIYIWIGIYLM